MLAVSSKSGVTALLLALVYRPSDAAMSAPSAAYPGPDALDLAALTEELSAPLDVTPHARAKLQALFACTATAAFRNQFSLAQVRALLLVLQRVLEADTAAWQRSAADSLAFFQAELLAASVERPPHAQGLLNPVQATAALDFVLKTYYRACVCPPAFRRLAFPRSPPPRGRPRGALPHPAPHSRHAAEHFTLYKTCCCRVPALSLVTRNTCEVEPPQQPPPLSEAAQVL